MEYPFITAGILTLLVSLLYFLDYKIRKRLEKFPLFVLENVVENPDSVRDFVKYKGFVFKLSIWIIHYYLFTSRRGKSL